MSSFAVPPPILFNLLKHHARTLEALVARLGTPDPMALTALAEQLRVVGTELMDLYTGGLAPSEIAGEIVAYLQAEGRAEEPAFAAWVASAGGYRTWTLPADQSVWVLRHAADAERFVHVHPGRWTPHTRRERANVVKTAVLTLAATKGGDPFDVTRINQVRQTYLNLPPLRALTPGQGLDSLLRLLAAP